MTHNSLLERRSKMKRPVGARAAACLTCLVLFVAGCGGTSTSGPNGSVTGSVQSDLSNLNRKAEVDSETAIVNLPVDAVDRGEQVDSTTLRAARDARVAQCARDELDIPWVAERPDPYIPAMHMWSMFGPWTQPVAEKFAFVEPMGDGALIVNGIVEEPADYEPIPWVNENIAEADRDKVFETCNSTEAVMEFDETRLWTIGPGQEALNEEQEAVIRDPEMQALSDELAVCFEENGMEMHRDFPGFPLNADFNNINEEQIALALKTVECKDQTNFTQRAADIIAERQVPMIEEYAEELFAAREEWDDTVAEAEEYIASHPELFELPTN